MNGDTARTARVRKMGRRVRRMGRTVRRVGVEEGEGVAGVKGDDGVVWVVSM